MSYNNVALAVIPSGIKSSIVYSLIGGNMTFARGSSATRRNKDGLIEYVDTSVPRLDYDGAIPHLLLEPSRTNSQTYSEAFNSWSKTNTTVSSNANIAPDGNTTADLILETTTSGVHSVNVGTYSGLSGTYTYSVFAKYNGRNLQIYSDNTSRFAARVIFNLQDGTIVQEDNGTGKIEAYKDGWYRCSVTGAIGSTSSFTVALRSVSGTTTSFAGDVTKGFYAWGAQMENGAYVTSYIPNLTTGSSTRAVESAVNASAELNDAEGVLFAEIKTQNLIPDANAYLGISDNSATNMLNIRFSTSGLVQIHNNGTGTSNRVYGETLTSDYIKIAVKYGRATGDYKVFINGEEKTIFGTFVATVMNGLNTFDLAYPTDTFPFLGMVRQAVVFDSGLTDAQLIELTR